ncbi:MAG: MoaD/ThiS family protein [Pedobacter sp.]
MNVHVKCLLNLSKENVCNYHDSTLHDVPTGTTAGELATRLQLNPDKIKLVFINYKECELDTELHEEDDIAFSPY